MMTLRFPDIPDASGDQKLIIDGSLQSKLPVNAHQFEQLMAVTEKVHHIHFRSVELILVDENEITEINREFLDRDYVTDIISFNYSDETDLLSIEGSLYCCLPRIVEQSYEFNASIQCELSRIFVHGLLHLAGYEDDTSEKRETMTLLENQILKLAGIEL